MLGWKLDELLQKTLEATQACEDAIHVQMNAEKSKTACKKTEKLI